MDFPFVKEALAQLFSKPSTMAFPAAPSPAKPNYRGRIVFHPDKCISCNMCERVCAGQAITHTSEPCEEGEEALIVRGTYIKKAPVKKAAPAAAPAAKPAAPKAAEAPKAEAKPAEEKPAAAADAKAAPAAEVTEEAPKPKRTRKPKTETADAAAAAGATVTEKAAEAAPEAPKAEEKAAPAEETAAPAAAPQPRDDGKPVQDPSKCIYCTLCARNCPAGALTVDRKAKTWVLDEDLCVACGTCQGACPKDAIIM